MTIGTRSYDVGSVRLLEFEWDTEFSELHVDGPAPLPNVWNFDFCA